jgi:hypothetical protein
MPAVFKVVRVGDLVLPTPRPWWEIVFPWWGATAAGKSIADELTTILNEMSREGWEYVGSHPPDLSRWPVTGRGYIVFRKSEDKRDNSQKNPIGAPWPVTDIKE